MDILFHCNHTILVTFRNEREGGREERRKEIRRQRKREMGGKGRIDSERRKE